MWDIEFCTSAARFDELAGPWDAALRAASIDNIFLTHAWLRRWWEVYGSGHDMWLMVARRRAGSGNGRAAEFSQASPGEIGAIAPLVLRRRPAGVRELVFMGQGEVAPNHMQFVVARDHASGAVQTICDELRRRDSEWDVLNFQSVGDAPANTHSVHDPPAHQSLLAGLNAAGITPRLSLHGPCRYATLPPTFDAYLSQRHGVTRRDTLGKRRKLLRDFPTASFGMVRSDFELDGAFEALIRLHQALWIGRGEAGVFASARFRRFHLAAAGDALRLNRLRCYYVQLDGEIIAVNLSYRVGRRIFGYNGGYDTRWHKYSVGKLLLLHVIEQSIAEGATELDMLQGVERYKDSWAAETRDDWSIHAASPHWRGQIAHFGLDAAIRLRKMWREHVPQATRRIVKRVLRSTRHVFAGA